MKLYRTSVKEDLNVDVVFQHLAENFVDKVVSCPPRIEPQDSLIIGERRREIIESPKKYSMTSYKVESVMKSANVVLRGRSGNRRNPHIGGHALGGHRSGNNNRFSNYCDPCTDYLNNPMFHSLHMRGRYNNYSNYSNYWSAMDKTITLRPNGEKRKSNLRTSCRVL